MAGGFLFFRATKKLVFEEIGKIKNTPSVDDGWGGFFDLVSSRPGITRSASRRRA